MLPKKTLILAEHRCQLERERRLRLKEKPCLFGVEFHTLDGLARTVAEQTRGLGGLLSAAREDRLLADAVIAEVSSITDESERKAWHLPGCIRQIGGYIRALRLMNPPPDGTAAGSSSANAAALVQGIRRRYEASLCNELDDAGVLLHLQNVLEDTNSALPVVFADIDTLLIIGFPEDQTEPWLARVITALAKRFERKNVCLRRTAPLPSPLLGTCLKIMSGESRGIVSDPAPEEVNRPAGKPLGVSLVQSPNTDVELRMVGRTLRALLGNATRDGLRMMTHVSSDFPVPDDILLVIPAVPDYRHRLARILDSYEIPHDAASDIAVSEAPLGEFVLKLAAFPLNIITADDLMWLLASPYVARSGLWPADAPMSLRALARQLHSRRLRAGTWAEWAQALPQALRDLEKQLSDEIARAADGEIGADQDDADECVRRIEQNIEHLKAVSTSLGTVIVTLANLFACPDGTSTVGAWVERLMKALDSLSVARKIRTVAHMHRNPTAACAPMLPDGSLEQAAVKAVSGVLEILAADGEAQTMDQREFVSTLELSLRGCLLSMSERCSLCVNVRTVAQVEPGVSWPMVFVLGMNENLLPMVWPDGGVLCDSGLKQLGLDHCTSVQRNKCDELALLSSLQVAKKQLTLSFSALAPDGKAALPSPVLQRLDDRLAVWTERNGVWERKGLVLGQKDGKPVSDWLKVLQPRHLLPNDTTATLPAEAEIANRLAGLALPEIPAEAETTDENERRAMQMAYEEQEWVKVSPPAEASDKAAVEEMPQTRFGDIDISAGLRPSQLDQFGYCPYRYFAQCVLGLQRSRDLNPVPDAMEIGIAVHEALEKTVNDTMALGQEHFHCATKAQATARIADFNLQLGNNLAASFVLLGKYNLAYDKATVEALRDRWLTALKSQVGGSLFWSDEEHAELRDQWAQAKQDEKTVVKQREALDEVIRLRSACEQSFVAYQDAPGESNPRGWAPLFNRLKTIITVCRNGKGSGKNHIEPITPGAPLPVAEWQAACKPLDEAIAKAQKEIDDAIKALSDSYDSVFADCNCTIPQGIPSGLKAVINAHHSLLERTFAPVRCEWRFSKPKEPLQVELDNGATLALRGTIDRIDVSTQMQPPRIRIADYKTSRKMNLNSEADIERGVDLQLPAYALAFAARHKAAHPLVDISDGCRLAEAVLFALRDGGFARAQAAGLEGSARQLLLAVKRHLETGRLAPKPRKKNKCPVLSPRASCDYAAVCRAGTIPQAWFDYGYAELKGEV